MSIWRKVFGVIFLACQLMFLGMVAGFPEMQCHNVYPNEALAQFLFWCSILAGFALAVASFTPKEFE